MNRAECETSPEFVPEWDVYRDKDGNPITVTWDQVQAIWRAYHVWKMVIHKEQADQPESLRQDYQMAANPASWQKSRLLGRMLTEGRPPTKTRPPVKYAGPRWDLLPDGDPFATEEIDRDQ